MSTYETSITNPKKQLEFYKQLSEQLQQEKRQLLKENKKQKEINQKAIEYINARQRKDGFLELNEWQTRDLLQILEDKDKEEENENISIY